MMSFYRISVLVLLAVASALNLACGATGPLRMAGVTFPKALLSKGSTDEFLVHEPRPNRRIVVVALIPNSNEVRFQTNNIRINDPTEQLSSTPFAVALTDDLSDFRDLLKLRGAIEATSPQGGQVRVSALPPLGDKEVSVRGNVKLGFAFWVSKDAKEVFLELPGVKPTYSIILPAETQ